MIKVVKFGGSSLANAEQFKKVGSIVRAEKERRYVVPSAPGKRFSADTKVTDLLYKCYGLAEADMDFTEVFSEIRSRYQEIIDGLSLDLNMDAHFEIIRENFLNKAGSDYAASRGEYLNGIIMAAYLGFEFIDAAEYITFHEDGTFDDVITDRKLSKKLRQTEYAVIPGFYGAYPDGSVKTFSRGGSDITGSIVARAAKADLYENWTDVSGFMLTDPRIIEDPEIIEVITYKELRELSYMGASVLHEDSIFPVRKAGIPINIRNTNAPEDKGTMIVADTSLKPRYAITGIAGRTGFASISIEKESMNSEIGYGRRVLQAIEDAGIPFEHMPSGIDTMTVYVNQKEFQEHEQQILSGIRRTCSPDKLELETDLALVAVVGRGMKKNKGIAARVFAALAHADINIKMIDQGSDEMNIIVGIEGNDFKAAVRAIYDVFVNMEL